MTIRAALAAAALAIAALAAVLIVPSHARAANDCSAVATDPTAAQYCNPTEAVGAPAGDEEESRSLAVADGEDPASGGGDVSSSAAGGSLPFTGADLLALVAVASVLLAVGLALRRLSAARPDTT